MSNDVVDFVLIFAALLLMALVAICYVVRVAYGAMKCAYENGYKAGKNHGIKWEKVRRKRVEERVERQMEERYQEADAGGWLKGINVD